ncbi:MAG: hypothetical protein ACPL7A_02625, partial [Anaerolineales bacterium]
VLFTFSDTPNYQVEVTETYPRKSAAIRCYQSQFTQLEMEDLLLSLKQKEYRSISMERDAYIESFMLLKPNQLHLNLHHQS